MGANNSLGWFQTLASPILDIANGFLNQYFAEQQMQQQFNYNKQMADINQKNALQSMQYQSDLNEISAQNAYNRNMQLYEQTQSTQAKVREMEQAGLSVGMMNGTPSQGGASSAGMGNTGLAAGAGTGVGLAGVSPINLVFDILGAKKLQAEIDLMNAEKDKTIEEKDNENIKGQMLSIDLWLKESTQNIDFQQKQIALQKANAELFIITNNKEHIDERNKAEINELNERANKAKAEALLAKANKELAEAKKTLTEQEALNAAQTFKKLQAETANQWVVVEDEDGNDIVIPKSQADYENFKSQLTNNLIKAGIEAGSDVLNMIVDFLLPGGKIKKLINVYNRNTYNVKGKGR